MTDRVGVIDTHTGGEPTRVVISGGPDLGEGPLADRVATFRDRFDRFRSAVVNEPRGSDVMVGALLVPPTDPSCATGVIFFNNVDPLGMCGHGAIGVAVALHHLGRIDLGKHRFETPVGTVGVDLQSANVAAIENVASYRSAKDVGVDLPSGHRIVGDVAWGGNWFFLAKEHGQEIAYQNRERLAAFASEVRRAVVEQGFPEADHSRDVDHVELFGPPTRPDLHSKNFVLCPGDAYDRSPCGTGTSAKVACMAEDGTLAEGEIWRQESLIGSVFEAWYRRAGQRIIPTIRGSAYVTAESSLILDPDDPFRWGIRP